MSDPGPSLTLPCLVGSFTCSRYLGAGAMGEVYLAHEEITGREVAVKILAQRLTTHTRALARFRREISAMGQLAHPGVPACAGYGELGERPYLAMDFIRGRPLDELLKGSLHLSEDLALWTVMRLVEIMAYCHQKVGMVHRDLKPGNVMVQGSDHGYGEHCQLRIIDFGLATYIDFGDFEDFSVGERGLAAGLTVAGEVVGTPAYMSPEQIRGETLGFQSDIYALGAILFHLLTGRLPYEGTSAMAVMAKHLDAPIPDPGQHLPLRPTTIGVVQRALAKEPRQRFRSYEQFLSTLQAARFAAQSATKRFARPVEGNPTPSTVLTLAPAPIPPAPEKPSEPITSGWRRPVKTPPPSQDPPTSGWHRPVG